VQTSSKNWRFGICLIPNEPPNEFVRSVKLAEELGFHYIWVADSSLHGRDAYPYLTLCALSTKRARIGINVTNPFSRHPAVTANAMATLDEISGGRAILGVGTGDRPQAELGFRPAKIDELKEWLALVRQLFSGETTTAEGNNWRLKDAKLHCGWRRELPIQMAASGPRILELAGEKADGVIARVGLAGEGIAFALGRLAAGATASGRSIDDLDIGVFANCCIYKDRRRALTEARLDAAWYLKTAEKLAEIVGVPKEITSAVQNAYSGGHLDQAHLAADQVPESIAQKFVLAGTPSEACEMVRRVGEHGIRRFEIFALGPEKNQIMRNFGEHVISALA
jgi:5,10-methylenetetrahydromethanopterin reductase